MTVPTLTPPSLRTPAAPLPAELLAEHAVAVHHQEGALNFFHRLSLNIPKARGPSSA